MEYLDKVYLVSGDDDLVVDLGLDRDLVVDLGIDRDLVVDLGMAGVSVD